MFICAKCLKPDDFHSAFQHAALLLCNKIRNAIDRIDKMFNSEFEAEMDESECATLQQYYRETMIQSYNFGFEVSFWHFLKSIIENICSSKLLRT